MSGRKTEFSSWHWSSYLAILLLISCLGTLLLLRQVRIDFIARGACDGSSITAGKDAALWENYRSLQKDLLRLQRHIVEAHRVTFNDLAKRELVQSFSIVRELQQRTVTFIEVRATQLNDKKHIVAPTTVAALPLELITGKSFGLSETLPPPSVDICPEQWLGVQAGYPLYEIGHVFTNCPNSLPLDSLLSFVLDASQHKRQQIIQILTELAEHYNNSLVYISGLPLHTSLCSFLKPENNDAENQEQLGFELQETTSGSGFQIFHMRNNQKFLKLSGTNRDIVSLLNSGQLRTKYTMLLPQSLFKFSDLNASVRRLMSAAFYYGFDVIGGSFRLVDSGQWDRGCYQLMLKNYTLRFIEGYFSSTRGCLVCDYTPGPFLFVTDLLRNFELRELTFGSSTSFGATENSSSTNKALSFLDWFLRLKKAGKMAAVCPDVMWELSSPKTSFANPRLFEREQFLPFVQKWKLNRITIEGTIHEYSCEEAGVSCSLRAGIARPICCLKELATMQRYAFHICQTHNIYCELCCGSQVGACKFKGILPWELDFDITYFSGHHDRLLRAANQFRLNGYDLKEDYGLSGCDSNFTACEKKGLVILWSKNYRGEFWGDLQPAISQWHAGVSAGLMRLDDSFNSAIQVPLFSVNHVAATAPPMFNNLTKMLVYGQWVNSFENPCKASRNQYGSDFFAHAEHWRAAGKSSSWQPYKTGFAPCPEPGFHACLDQYFPDGDLQFRDDFIG